MSCALGAGAVPTEAPVWSSRDLSSRAVTALLDGLGPRRLRGEDPLGGGVAGGPGMWGRQAPQGPSSAVSHRWDGEQLQNQRSAGVCSLAPTEPAGHVASSHFPPAEMRIPTSPGCLGDPAEKAKPRHPGGSEQDHGYSRTTSLAKPRH